MTIYTDGANKGNGKASTVGGWGFIVVENDESVYSETGVNLDTTNNREELKAVIHALDYCVKNNLKHVLITTDSQYVQLGITQWINKWESNGWKTSDKKPVKNKDLWQEFRTLAKESEPEFLWVKGHADDAWNIKCDQLINQTIKQYQNGNSNSDNSN